MRVVLVLLIYICVVKLGMAKFMGSIVGGNLSDIEDFSYAVYISKTCSNQTSSCGASIVNQAILLTAAHCLVKCRGNFHIKAYTGSVRKFKGLETKVVSFRMHEKYNNTSLENDIALLKLENNLEFGTKVKRVALMRQPPTYENAIVAGWGWIDSAGTKSEYLKHTYQKVISQKICDMSLHSTPAGTICGTDETNRNYPEKGDSGSALVIQNYIQIGLVSFKKRVYTNSTIVYTDVSYFYEWITENAEQLYCSCTESQLLLRDHNCY